MKRNEVAPDSVSYSTMIHACTRASATSRAEFWLKEMMSQGNLKVDAPVSFCYNTVIQALAQENKAAKAEHYLRAAIAAKADVTAACFCSVAAAFTRAGDAQRAEHWQAQSTKLGVFGGSKADSAGRRGKMH